ncbi:TPA: RNA-directed DNA polymerase, partial [Aeromonas hydrophila]|nr:RNA-directed DNA polymerase [Aeromonas hydrophila]
MSNNIFITEKLKYIYNKENKKGRNLEGLFFHDVKELSQKIKAKRYDISFLRRNMELVIDFDLELTKKHDELKALKATKNQLIESNLNRIAEEISRKDFTLKLVEGPIVSDKPTYKLFTSPVGYFAEKLVQYNIATAYDIKISDRDSIVSSLISILDDNIPKIIIRTDISSFFESIPHSLLIKKLDSYSNLNVTTRKIIRTILKYYTSNTLNEKGIPRGIGISSYLSEMFMQEIDTSISCMENAIYYKRYVDDIVVIFSPPIKPDGSELLSEITKIIKSHK